ncbi:hypothetical protein B0T25DRAFT_584041 [Lasiosphaeria hispida]|uniref:ABM domain-containing protein n=1 Tax=Lasiosphaeria hispida TaxID=260671 RepID=A0AAJ0MBA2_9PEZI|nr:hypothetical protein B0T25DRAFT_584041 [Lasiosphaeria hispida]
MSSASLEPEFLTNLPPVPDDEFCVYGTVYAYPEHADALEVAYAIATHIAKFEPGTVYYCISRDTDNPAVFHFFERYTGRKAFDAHNEQPAVQKLLKEDKYIKDVTAKFAKPILPVWAG